MKQRFELYEPDLIPTARRLRKNATFPERLLWSRLRHRQLGVRFLRQHPVGSYVVDFFCPEARLVVEVDGRSHHERFEYDSVRQTFLEREGMFVIRFTNDEILHDLDEVIFQLRTWLQDRLSSDFGGVLDR